MSVSVRTMLAGVISVLLPCQLWAGEVTDNVMGITSVLNSFVSNVSLVLGIAFLLGSILQYFQHRKNPSQVRLSQPVMLFILGLVLVLLPVLGMQASGGQLLGG